jgi:hypothetical protein
MTGPSSRIFARLGSGFCLNAYDAPGKNPCALRSPRRHLDRRVQVNRDIPGSFARTTPSELRLSRCLVEVFPWPADLHACFLVRCRAGVFSGPLADTASRGAWLRMSLSTSTAERSSTAARFVMTRVMPSVQSLTPSSAGTTATAWPSNPARSSKPGAAPLSPVVRVGQPIMLFITALRFGVGQEYRAEQKPRKHSRAEPGCGPICDGCSADALPTKPSRRTPEGSIPLPTGPATRWCGQERPRGSTRAGSERRDRAGPHTPSPDRWNTGTLDALVARHQGNTECHRSGGDHAIRHVGN